MATLFRRNATLAYQTLVVALVLAAANADTDNTSEVEPVRLEEDEVNKLSAENNIAFDLPDLTAAVETVHGKFQLEAFRSVNNDRILQDNKGVPKVSQLIWVSIGQPTLVKTYSSSSDKVGSVFHFTHEGFHTYLQMMTEEHQQKFAGIASAKYNFTCKPSQIVNLILSKFQCSFTLYDAGRQKYLIAGTVTEFRHFPLRMDFFAPLDSPERNLFMKFISSSQNPVDLRLSCSIASKGKRLLTNRLTIDSQQMDEIGLDTKLFGPSSSGPNTVYVTREQSSMLAREMYASLNIIEDYEMPETQFSEAFIDGLISQVATSTFSFQSIDTVLAAMSKYRLDISGDLKPDIIKRDLGQILKVEKREDKSRIILDQSTASKYDESWKNSAGFSLGCFGVKFGVNWAKENSKSGSQQTRSLNDQLRELNKFSQNDVKWEIEGEKVVPKSLNVVQMSRSKFSKDLVFSRVRIQRFDAQFVGEFSLYLSKAIPSTPLFDLLNRRFEEKMSNLKLDLETKLQNTATSSKVYTENVSSTLKSDLERKLQTTAASSKVYTDSASSSLKSRIEKANGRITNLWGKALKRCRICFYVQDGASSRPVCTDSNRGNVDLQGLMRVPAIFKCYT